MSTEGTESWEKLFGERGVVGLGDEGVLLEIIVVAVREIGAVVGATAFFAGQSGAGDEGAEAVEIL